MEAKFLHDGACAVFERFEFLKAMNRIVKSCNDEAVYEQWIYVIPDQCEDDELLDIAMNLPETYGDACKLFLELMASEEVKDGGFYVGNQVF